MEIKILILVITFMVVITLVVIQHFYSHTRKAQKFCDWGHLFLAEGIEKLEKENASLKKELNELREKVDALQKQL